MARILTKLEKDMNAYLFYSERRKNGRTKMQAVYDTMDEFNIASAITVYRIKKRCEALLEAEKRQHGEAVKG